jgi:hypothetical protein
VGANFDPVLVHGPYLVRFVEIDGDTIHLTGDWSDETRVEVWAPKEVFKVTFNGKALEVKKSCYRTLVGTVPASNVTVDSVENLLPTLLWKVAEGLPEAATDYDDSNWTGRPCPILDIVRACQLFAGQD